MSQPTGRDNYNRLGDVLPLAPPSARPGQSLERQGPHWMPPLHTWVQGHVAPSTRRQGWRAPHRLQLVTRMVSIRLRLDSLARRRSVGWVGHRGQAVGQGHGAGNNTFHSSWDASGGHTHHTWRVPAGRGEQTCEVIYRELHRLHTALSAWGISDPCGPERLGAVSTCSVWAASLPGFSPAVFPKPIP